MAEFEPGHPDELVRLFLNWLREARSPEGTLLPHGISPEEWAVRQFINSWQGTVRIAIDSIEESLNRAIALCDSGSSSVEVKTELETALQALAGSLRDELGLYEWNK